MCVCAMCVHVCMHVCVCVCVCVWCVCGVCAMCVHVCVVCVCVCVCVTEDYVIVSQWNILKVRAY